MTPTKPKPRKPRPFKMNGYEYMYLDTDSLRTMQGLMFCRDDLKRLHKWLGRAIAWQKGERR